MKTKYAVTLAVLFAMVICLCLLQTASAADFSKSYSPGNGYVTQLAIQITSVLGGEQVTSLQLKNGGTVLASVDNQYVNNGWNYFNIDPVFVYSGTTYTLYATMSDYPYLSIDDLSATFVQYYLITVNSAYGSPTASAYVQSGHNYAVSVTSPETISSTVREACTGYTIDGGGLTAGTSYTFTSVSADHTITFNWQAQYYITVYSLYGSPTVSQWANAGSDLTVSVTSPVYGTESGGIRPVYTCQGYSIDGGELNAGTSVTLSYIQAPISVLFSWAESYQYYLTVSSPHGTATGSGWYDAGATAYAGLSSGTESGGSGTQYNFNSWSNGGTNYTASNPITMNYPISVSASWVTQYYLTVTSPYSTTSGSGWYNVGATAYAGVATNIVIDGTGTHTLQGWTGDASGSGLTSNAITMTAPKIATAAWSTSSGGGGSTNYTVTLNGPYYEDGTAASGETISCTLLYANSSVYSFSMNSSVGTPDTKTITSTSPFIQLQWNASSTQNYTRIYRFMTSVTNDTVNLYIVRSDKPSFLYTFSVTDFYGMISPYLEVRISPDGTNSYVVERADLSEGGGTVTFVLTQYQLYTLVFVCSQGTYSQTFTASIQGTPGQYAVSLNVLSGNFPTSTNMANATATVTRLNGTAILTTFTDPNSTTTWVYIKITHLQGSISVTDYVGNTTGSMQNIYWLLADPAINYYVEIQAYVNGSIQVWHLTAGSASSTNPWNGVFDWLGQSIGVLPQMHMGWPEGMTGTHIAEIVACIIVALFLCIGSFRSAGTCAILSWIMFGILLVMGWLGAVTIYTIPEFAFSGFFAIIIAIEEGKREVREF